MSLQKMTNVKQEGEGSRSTRGWPWPWRCMRGSARAAAAGLPADKRAAPLNMPCIRDRAQEAVATPRGAHCQVEHPVNTRPDKTMVQ